MPGIVVVGMSNTDLVCRAPRLPVAGETIAGTSFDSFAGGKGANQAVAAARVGANVWFCGAAGDDNYGRARREDLHAEGIDTSGMQTIPNATSGIALIVVDGSGENQIVTVAGANGQVDAGKVSDFIASLDYDLVLMTWELAPETSMRVVASLRRDVTLVLNTAPFHESVKEVLPDERAIVVCNEVEAGQLLGRKVNAGSAEPAAKEIVSLGCRAAIITLGAAGAVGASADEMWQCASPVVEVVDTTGAGDSFCGAFAAWLVSGASLTEATEAGVHAGSIATARPGAQPSIPLQDQITESLQRKS